MYQQIIGIRREIADTEEELIRQKEFNKQESRKIEILLRQQENTRKIIQSKHRNIILRDKLHEKIDVIIQENSDIFRKLQNILLIFNETLSHIKNELTNLTEKEHILSQCLKKTSKTDFKKIEMQLNKIRWKLLSKLQNIANISETTLFNIDLSKVIDHPKETRMELWYQHLQPEQYSVFLLYFQQIVRVVSTYFFQYNRYNPYIGKNALVDIIFGTKYKIKEKDYKTYKNNNSLLPTLRCLEGVLQNIHGGLQLEDLSESRPLKCLADIFNKARKMSTKTVNKN
jgi:hypothetical protein